MLVLVGCHVARAHHLHPLRDARTDKRVDKDTGIEQVAPELKCNHVVTDNHGYDGCLSVDDFEPELLEARPHLVGVSDEFIDAFRFLFEDIEGEERTINYLKHHSPALIFSASPT